MRGLHGKRPGVQVERALEGACEGPPPWQRRGAWEERMASGADMRGGPQQRPPALQHVRG